MVSNLFPVVEIPKVIFSAETRLRIEAEIHGSCAGPGPLPFLLKGTRLYTVAPLTDNSVFRPALEPEGKPSQESFAHWLSGGGACNLGDRAPEPLLRYHAWKRGLRFDEAQGLFYFTRSKPKNLWWEIGGKIVQREVTAPHMKSNQIDGQTMAEFQCGWRHEAVRAGFVQVAGDLFLASGTGMAADRAGWKDTINKPSGWAREHFSAQSRQWNGQVLRTLRFWSAVFAKGHREIRIEAGANPIRVRLTPASGSSQSINLKRSDGLRHLALTDIEDAQSIPELGPIEG